jgi:hypothetical protein
MAQVYNANYNPGGPGAPNDNNMMAIEAEKSQIMQDRAGGEDAPGIGNVCSGLKQYPWGGFSGDARVFGTTATLGQLISDFQSDPYSGSDNGSTIYNQVMTRLYQMASNSKGTGSTVTSASINSAVSSALASSLPLGQTMYIWMDASGNFHNTTASGLPPYFSASTTPDGSSLESLSATTGIDDVFVNFANEEGYPHPWDCPSTNATNHNVEDWTRSSGYNGLLGVLEFKDCVSDTQTWTCPC